MNFNLPKHEKTKKLKPNSIVPLTNYFEKKELIENTESLFIPDKRNMVLARIK